MVYRQSKDKVKIRWLKWTVRQRGAVRLEERAADIESLNLFSTLLGRWDSHPCSFQSVLLKCMLARTKYALQAAMGALKVAIKVVWMINN